MSALDFSFVEWDIFNKFVLKGMLFSVELTIIATVGGIFCLSALTVANLGRMYDAYDKENQIDKKAREVLQSSGHQNVSWKHYHPRRTSRPQP